MAIQLDKILADIAKEKVLHPNNGGASKQEQDEAWQRIGRLNKLSVHESRSIFIVLQKKYDQEKIKGNSTWKLFGLMHQIHQESKTQGKTEDEQLPLEDEEYEMLEVQEHEEDEEGSAQFAQAANSTGSASSDGESPSKSHSAGGSPEKEEKTFTKTMVDTPRPAAAYEEKKLLNTLAHNTPRASAATSVSVAAAALQKKGITLKKTPGASMVQKPTPPSTPAQQQSNSKAGSRTTIQLPDSLKRKLSEEYSTSPAAQKKLLKGVASPKQTQTIAASAEPSPSAAAAGVVHTTTAQLLQVKKERSESNQSPPPGINIITIPATPLVNGNNMGGATASSSTAATVASTSTNGYSPHNIDELNFNNDIIFDAGTGSGQGKINAAAGATAEIINLGNFDTSLPPTFFKNLCNSSRHEALGLYVANVMNRLSRRAAAKLELGILRAIVDVQSDELEQ